MKTVNLEILDYPAHEMAFIRIDGDIVFTGNYHDFHKGCHGTKIWNYDVNGIWDRGIKSLAMALKTKAKEDEIEVQISEKKLTAEEYKKLV